LPAPFDIMRKVTDPSVEPISLAEAKIYLKVDDTTEDALITLLIKAARIRCEKETGRQLITTVIDHYFDEFPDKDECYDFLLYGCPVNSITSVKYYDDSDVQQTLANTVYLLDGVSAPARVSLMYGQSWPSTSERANAIEIKTSCGYGAAGSNVPAALIAGMYLHLGHLYENRQDVTKENMNELPMGSKSLYNLYHVY